MSTNRFLQRASAQHLKTYIGTSLWCDACKNDVGSGKQDVRNHIVTKKHADNVALHFLDLVGVLGLDEAAETDDRLC